MSSNQTSKQEAPLGGSNVLASVFNQVDKSITTAGFLFGNGSQLTGVNATNASYTAELLASTTMA